MAPKVELSADAGRKIVWLLDALDVFLQEPLSADTQDKLELAVGPEVVRYPEAVARVNIAKLAAELRDVIKPQMP